MSEANFKAFWEEMRQRRLQEIVQKWGESWSEEGYVQMTRELAELKQFNELFSSFIDSFKTWR